MSIQVTCTGCRAAFQVADASRGKQIRCPSCKTVFIAGATTANGNGPSSTPAAKSRAITSNAARPKAAPPVVLEAVDEDSPPEQKKKNALLPTCLIGCGILFVLCGGGGSIGGYFAWKGITKLKNEAAVKVDRIKEQIEKAEADQKRIHDEAQKNIEDQRRLQEETRRRIQDQLNKNNPGKAPNQVPNPPFQPPDRPNLPRPKPQGEVVQAVARSIPLAGKPFEIQDVQWTGVEGRQAAIILRAGSATRLDQYDLTNGRKLGNVELPTPLLPSGVRDISLDGNYYVCVHTGRSYSLWAMPNPKPIVDKWRPPPGKREPGKSTTHRVIAAYLLNGPRLLTVNDAGQVALWSVPKGADEQPSLQMSFVPEEKVARYPARLTPHCTVLSPDRSRLAVFNGRDGFYLLDTDKLQLQGDVKSPEDALEAIGTFHGKLSAAFSPDGKHLAASFQPQVRRPPGGAANAPQLLRWDVQTRQRTARIADPSKGVTDTDTRIGWWGNDYCWIASSTRAGTLLSWDKQKVVLQASLKPLEKLYFGNADGKCWLCAPGPDGNAVLKGIDLPAALQRAEQPLWLMADGIVRK